MSITCLPKLLLFKFVLEQEIGFYTIEESWKLNKSSIRTLRNLKKSPFTHYSDVSFTKRHCHEDLQSSIDEAAGSC